MCAVDNFQHFIFGNSHSYDKFTGKTKIVSHLTSSQEILKQQINVYVYIVYHLRGQWDSLISPHTAKIPLLDSYSFPVTCPTHVRPYCLTKNHPPNMFQQHISTVILQYVAQLINIGRTHILFDHAFFKTDLFLKYKGTMGTFCSTSVNPLSQSLRAVLS